MPPDARQRVDQAGEMPALAALAHLFPIRMIAILPPAGGIAAHRLQRRGFVFGIDDIDVGRRHRQTRQPLDDARVADAAAVLAVIAEAAAAAPALDGQAIACGARRALRGVFEGSASPRRHACSAVVTAGFPGRAVKSGCPDGSGLRQAWNFSMRDRVVSPCCFSAHGGRARQDGLAWTVILGTDRTHGKARRREEQLTARRPQLGSHHTLPVKLRPGSASP